MKHFYFQNQHDLHDLVFQYEVMSQKGKVFKLEETAYLQLAEFYENKESSTKALQIVNQAIKQYSYSAELYLRQAKLLLNEGKMDEALFSLDHAENLGTPPKELKIVRAHAMSLRKEYRGALDLLSDLKVDYYVTNIELSNIYFREAWIFERLEQFDRMYFSLKQALIENPGNKEALERIWIAVELSRNHSQSVELHNHLLEIDSYSYQAWFNLGHAYYSLNDYEKAIQAFEFAFLINEKFELAYRDYAEVCFELTYYDKALKCYLEILELFESDPDILSKVGECYEYMDNTAKAKIYFFRALNLDPRNDEVYFHIGECYSKEKHWDSAVHFYKQAIKLDETREDYMFGLANAYQKLNRPQKAFPLYQKAIEIGPEQTNYWTRYAYYLLSLGRYQEALVLLDEAEINIYSVEVLYYKACCLFQMNNRKLMLDTLGEALSEQFEDHQIIFETIPEMKEDKDIKAIIKYYELEP